MYKKILVPVDGSELSLAAVDEALKLAQSLNAEICFYHANVIAIPPMMATEAIQGGQTVGEIFSKSQQAHGNAVLSSVTARANTGDVKFTTFSSTSDSPWKGIVEAAREMRCDLILMASHGRRGLSSMLLGSETQRVLTHSVTPVLVHRVAKN